MLPNTIQLFVVNHVIKIVINRFQEENRYGDNRSSDVGRNKSCNLFHMTFNHVLSYNGLIDGGDFRYKSNVVVDDAPTFDVDESVNDQMISQI